MSKKKQETKQTSAPKQAQTSAPKQAQAQTSAPKASEAPKAQASEAPKRVSPIAKIAVKVLVDGMEVQAQIFEVSYLDEKGIAKAKRFGDKDKAKEFLRGQKAFTVPKMVRIARRMQAIMEDMVHALEENPGMLTSLVGAENTDAFERLYTLVCDMALAPPEADPPKEEAPKK